MPTKNSRQANQPETPVVAKSTMPEPTVLAGSSVLPGSTGSLGSVNTDLFTGSESSDAQGSEPARLRLLPPVSAPSSGFDPTRAAKGQLPRRSPDDALVHRESRPKFCPNCGEAFESRTPATGIVVEFWTSRNRVFHCWCACCGEAFDIAEANLVVTEEIEH